MKLYQILGVVAAAWAVPLVYLGILHLFGANPRAETALASLAVAQVAACVAGLVAWRRGW